MMKISKGLPVLLKSDNQEVSHVMSLQEHERLYGKVHSDGCQSNNPDGDWSADLSLGHGRVVVFGYAIHGVDVVLLRDG